MTKTKTGAASLYVVIFTTLLLGILTLGFVRIMLSDSLQTTNTDLSQSAFDSALAGIEDAKVAILKYHACGTDGDAEGCADVRKAMNNEENTPDANCDVVREALGRPGELETPVQAADGAGSELEQAYTCVLISNRTSNYLSQLNSNYHAKLVPLQITGDLNSIQAVKLEWYSTTNHNDNPAVINPIGNSNTNKPSSINKITNTGLFPALNANTPPSPPTIGVQLIQTGTTFSLLELDTNQVDATDRGTLLLVPSTSESAAKGKIASNHTTGFPASSDKAINTPIPVQCSSATDPDSLTPYFCTTILEIPKQIGTSRGTAFLRVFLPYGTPNTDFSVTVCSDKDCNNILGFDGVQASIDATGRANNLFRRVEARVELVDIYFPYPEYSVSLNSIENTLTKNFWVTKSDWQGKNSGTL